MDSASCSKDTEEVRLSGSQSRALIILVDVDTYCGKHGQEHLKQADDVDLGVSIIHALRIS